MHLGPPEILRLLGPLKAPSTGGSRRSHWRGPAAGSAKNTEQISDLGGSEGMPPGKFIFNKAKCLKLGLFFFIFVRPLGGP